MGFDGIKFDYREIMLKHQEMMFQYQNRVLKCKERCQVLSPWRFDGAARVLVDAAKLSMPLNLKILYQAFNLAASVILNEMATSCVGRPPVPIDETAGE